MSGDGGYFATAYGPGVPSSDQELLVVAATAWASEFLAGYDGGWHDSKDGKTLVNAGQLALLAATLLKLHVDNTP